MKTNITSKLLPYIFFTMLIIAGSCFFCHGFFTQKSCLNSDEITNFGIANSYYSPYISISDNQLYTKNLNKWNSGTVLRDYLTVQKNEIFSFGSIFYNAACNTASPLYYCVLHIISSFFINQYLPAIGFFINLVCYTILSIFLYKLAILCCQSPYIALGAVAFNTFTVGTFSMVIYIDAFSMLSMFAVIFTYITAKFYYKPVEAGKTSCSIALGCVSFFGVLTHYFFLPFVCSITLILCIHWLIKRKHILTKYALCIFIGIFLSIIVFPATLLYISDLPLSHYQDRDTYTDSELISNIETSSSAENIELSVEDIKTSTDVSSESETISSNNHIAYASWKMFKYYFLSCSQMMLRENLGFSPISPYNQGIAMYIPICLIVLIILLIVISFLFRKESWFISKRTALVSIIKQLPSKIKKIKFTHFNWLILAIISTIVTILSTCSTDSHINILSLSDLTTKYLFIIYPLFNFLLYLLLYFLLHLFVSHIFHVCKNKVNYITTTASYIVVICMLITNHTIRTSYYIWNTTAFTDTISGFSNNSNILIVSQSNNLLESYIPFIYHCSDFYFSTDIDINNESFLSETYTPEKQLYLYLDSSLLSSEDASIVTADTIKNKLITLDNVTTFEYIGDSVLNDFSIKIYRLR